MNHEQLIGVVLVAWPCEGLGAIAPPHFGQDARDFLKIDEKIGVGKVK